MPQSVFDYKLPSQVQGAAWTYTWTPGPALANLYALYPSQGDVTISEPTNIVTTEDGPVQVAAYDDLTVNAKLSTTKRGRGLFFLYRNIHIGTDGDISMTGRGAKGHGGWVVNDLTVPESVTISGRYGSPQAVLKLIGQRGWYIGDPNLWASPPPELALLGVTATIVKGAVLVSAAGCGRGASGVRSSGTSSGSPGQAGTDGPGGGASGSVSGGGSSYMAQSAGGGRGYPWGGGPASGPSAYNGGAYSWDSAPEGATSSEVGQYCGKGGDAVYQMTGAGSAGNPGGRGLTNYGGSAEYGKDGVGGILIGIGQGNTVIDAGGVVQADGMQGGNAVSVAGYSAVAGSGSGGGRVFLAHAGSYSNNGTVRANGGLGGVASGPGTNANGAPGGAGDVDVKSFAELGWAA